MRPGRCAARRSSRKPCCAGTCRRLDSDCDCCCPRAVEHWRAALGELRSASGECAAVAPCPIVTMNRAGRPAAGSMGTYSSSPTASVRRSVGSICTKYCRLPLTSGCQPDGDAIGLFGVRCARARGSSAVHRKREPDRSRHSGRRSTRVGGKRSSASCVRSAAVPPLGNTTMHNRCTCPPRPAHRSEIYAFVIVRERLQDFGLDLQDVFLLAIDAVHANYRRPPARPTSAAARFHSSHALPSLKRPMTARRVHQRVAMHRVRRVKSFLPPQSFWWISPPSCTLLAAGS